MLLSLQEIKPGMTLEQPVVHPENGNILLYANTTLTLKNIDKLREYKLETVDVADRYSVYVSPTDMMAQSLAKDFIHILRQTCPKRPEANMNDNVVAAANNLEKLIFKIARNEDILSFLVEEKLIDNLRLYNHSLYTAVLSGIVASCMKLPTDEVVCCIIGALLHNIGMCEMPLLVGQTNLTGQQESLYKEHPTYGYYFAIQKNIPRKIAECIQSHHEKWNGSGFPKGLKGEEIPISSRIIALCANYSSKVTYQNIPPYMAVEELYGTSGILYDYNVVQAFVKNIPIYPLGVIVRLSTKEVGIVSNIRKNEGPRPIVKVYYNRVNKPISEDKIVDLGKERTIFIEEIL